MSLEPDVAPESEMIPALKARAEAAEAKVEVARTELARLSRRLIQRASGESEYAVREALIAARREVEAVFKGVGHNYSAPSHHDEWGWHPAGAAPGDCKECVALTAMSATEATR